MARLAYLAAAASVATFLATVSAVPIYVPEPGFNLPADDLTLLNATVSADEAAAAAAAAALARLHHPLLPLPLLPRDSRNKPTGNLRQDPLRCPPDLPEGMYFEDLRPHDFTVAQGAMCFFTFDWGPCCSQGSKPNWGTKECMMKWGDPWYPERAVDRELWTTDKCPSAPKRPLPVDPEADFDG